MRAAEVSALLAAALAAGDTATVETVRQARKGDARAKKRLTRILASDWWALGGYGGP